MVQGARPKDTPSATTSAKHQGLPEDEDAGLIPGRLCWLTSQCSRVYDVHLHALRNPWSITVSGHHVQAMPFY